MLSNLLNKSDSNNQYDGSLVRDQLSIGMNQVNDMIAPDSITKERNLYALGDTLVRTLMVTGYPRTVYMGWLDDLYSFDANIDISIHITPWDTTRVIKTLNKRISQYLSTINMDDKKGNVTDVEITTALEDAEELRRDLQTGSSKLFYQAIYISISARYIEELDQLTDDVESICGAAQMTTRSTIYRQDSGFLSVLPLGDDRIKKIRNFDTDSLSTCFPLVSSELTDMRGSPILYGVNQSNTSLVMFDRFRLNNFNSVTLATSGVGKSYAVKLEAIRYYLTGTKVIIIDPEGEYKKLADEFGGQYINLSTSSGDRINPLDIFEGVRQEDEERNFLSTKIMDVYLLIQLMLEGERNLSVDERRVILTAIQEMYAKFGINRDGFTQKEEDSYLVSKEFLTVGSQSQKMPILSDLDAALKQQGQEGIRIAEEISPYVTGVLDLFNGETNVDLENDFIVFGIKDLEEGFRDLAMFIGLEHIWNKIKSGDLERRLLTVDEAWILLQNKSSASFLEKVARTARKFNTGISLISHNVKDFVENKMESILTNTSMQFLLRQESSELRHLEEVLGISESEKSLLSTLDVGEALLFAGQDKALISIVSNGFEHELCNTTKEG